MKGIQMRNGAAKIRIVLAALVLRGFTAGGIAQDVAEPITVSSDLVLMFGEIYPSVVVSMATVDFSTVINEEGAANFVTALTAASIDGVVGKPNPGLAVVLSGVEEGQAFSLDIKGGKFLQSGKAEGTVPASGNIAVFPDLVWNFDVLQGNRNVVPENLSLTVTINGRKLPVVTKTVRVRSARDCPFLLLSSKLPGTESDAPTISSLMAFAAFVNEKHPVVDTILAEALSLGIVDSFLGPSQAEPARQLEELFAVWKALRKRGIQYGNLTQPSGESDTVVAQNIRTIDESLKSKQANCVDGSVLLASIYRGMGYDVALVIVPGHCFLSVIAGESAVQIETTVIGRQQQGSTDPLCALPNPLDPADQAAQFFGSVKPDFGPERYERGLFHFAIQKGAIETQEALNMTAEGDETNATLVPEFLGDEKPPIRFVVIGDARKLGVTPLE